MHNFVEEIFQCLTRKIEEDNFSFFMVTVAKREKNIIWSLKNESFVTSTVSY